MFFKDIKSFAVVAGPGEVRWTLTKEGELQVFVGAGLVRAPADALHAEITEGHSTFVIKTLDPL